MLPSFIVIGAARSGTTSLHRYLGAHPQVFTSERKELDFFLEGHEARGDVRWYEAQFANAGDAVARGESSPRYTQYPEFRCHPDRMAAMLPGVRLVYLVRHPVERAISHYGNRWTHGVERRPVTRAILEDPFYLAGSRYAFQIDRYLRTFPRDRIQIITSEALRDRREETVRRVLRFIGVDDAWSSSELQTLHNPSEGRTGSMKWARTVRASDWYARVKPLIPGPVRRLAVRTARRRLPLRVLRVTPGFREHAAGLLADDVARFREIAGEEIDGWGIA